ncbi:MAG: hypothetical protein N2C12_10695, partial [Planctomycetales bacterium]
MNVVGTPAAFEPVVISGIGMITSVGRSAERTWDAVRNGASGVRSITGLPGIPDHLLLGAPVDVNCPVPGQAKVVTLSQIAAAEAIQDAKVDFAAIEPERFGCAISGHMGDTDGIAQLWTGIDRKP